MYRSIRTKKGRRGKGRSREKERTKKNEQETTNDVLYMSTKRRLESRLQNNERQYKEEK